VRIEKLRRPTAVRRAGEPIDGRVVPDDGTHAFRVERGVDGQAFGPMELMVVEDGHAFEALGIAQPPDERQRQGLGRLHAPVPDGDGRRIHHLQEARAQIDLPTLVGRIAIDRDVQAQGPQAFGAVREEMRAHLDRTARRVPIGRETARMPQELEHRVGRRQIAQPAMEDAARPAGGVRRQIALLGREHRITRGREMLRGTGACDAPAHHEHVEALAVVIRQRPAHGGPPVRMACGAVVAPDPFLR
jgi:hypothetical protein